MTFTVLRQPKRPCSFPIIVTLSEPVFTFGLAWAGYLHPSMARYALFAYALIFASFAHHALSNVERARRQLILTYSNGLECPADLSCSGNCTSDWHPARRLPRSVPLRTKTASDDRPVWFSLLPIGPHRAARGNQISTGQMKLFQGQAGVEHSMDHFLGISLIVLITDLIASALLFCSRRSISITSIDLDHIWANQILPLKRSKDSTVFFFIILFNLPDGATTFQL